MHTPACVSSAPRVVHVAGLHLRHMCYSSLSNGRCHVPRQACFVEHLLGLFYTREDGVHRACAEEHGTCCLDDDTRSIFSSSVQRHIWLNCFLHGCDVSARVFLYFQIWLPPQFCLGTLGCAVSKKVRGGRTSKGTRAVRSEEGASDDGASFREHSMHSTSVEGGPRIACKTDKGTKLWERGGRGHMFVSSWIN